MAACAYSAMNATFDFSPLHKAGGAYHVEDKFDHTRNFTYAMNVCGSVDPRELPSTCDEMDAASAFQVAQWNEHPCYRLGGVVGNSSLLDEADPRHKGHGHGHGGHHKVHPEGGHDDHGHADH